MLCAAVAGAVAVGAAVGDALVAPLLTDVEGEGLGVLGDVGAEAVTADAGEGELVRVAVVAEGGGGVGGLEADEGALGWLGTVG